MVNGKKVLEHQLLIRMPKDIKNKIYKKATENGRSMNAEIVFRLRMSLHNECAENESKSAKVNRNEY